MAPDLTGHLRPTLRSKLSAQTAMARTALSRPMTLAMEDAVIRITDSVLDYGCGRGGDVERLRALGIAASGWDPWHAPSGARHEADVVNLGYVVNVIEEPAERRDALLEAWALARRALVVAARPRWEERGITGIPHRDGWITSKGTFQRFFDQDEMRRWLDDALGVASLAAAPGIFYVFRDPKDAEGFRARQVRRTGHTVRLTSEAMFETHRELLDELCSFVDDHGRLPEPAELDAGPQLVTTFRSIRNAFRIVIRITGDDRWAVARTAAEKHVLVYLALSAFAKRPRMSDLPDDLQRDIRYLFGSYRSAVQEADRLLFAAGQQDELNSAIADSGVGKVLPDALYVHVSALPLIPPVLRVYEGCAHVLVGTVEEATLIKLHRVERKVGYLSYPEFDRVGHPALATSLRADLRTFDVKWMDFRTSDSPPILHRKELLVSNDYPGYGKFQRLTRQEERAGLLGGAGIGMRGTWEQLLAAEGWQLCGHSLRRRSPAQR